MIEQTLIEFKDKFDTWCKRDMLNKVHPVPNFVFRYGCIYIYIRNMAKGIYHGKPVVCIANVSIIDECQNKGLFTAIIDYIKKNPQQFFELEVELVHTEYLRDSLVKQGFRPGTLGFDNLTFVYHLK